jgi:hypothetical protein
MRTVFFGEVRHVTNSTVIVPASGTTFVAVLPITAATASLSATVTVFLCLYPFCHLFFRWRYLH